MFPTRSPCSMKSSIQVKWTSQPSSVSSTSSICVNAQFTESTDDRESAAIEYSISQTAQQTLCGLSGT